MNTARTNVLLAFLSVSLSSPAWSQSVHQHQLTVASNAKLAVTDAEVDSIISEMNKLISSASYPWDAACAEVEFLRKGNVIQSDKLPLAGTYQALARELAAIVPGAHVLIVSGITCGPVMAVGCGAIGGEPMVVGQPLGYEGQLWLHERGHNVGLKHAAEPPAVDTTVAQDVGMRFMFWRLGIGHVGKTASECAQFKTAKLSSIVPVSRTKVAATGAGPGAGPGIRLSVAEMTFKGPEDLDTILKEAAKQANLTLDAYKVIGAPWMEGVPVEEIKRLKPVDVNSIRVMLRGEVNRLWSQAINVLAIVGNAEDVGLIKRALELPAPEIGLDASPDSVRRFRNLLQIKLSAPLALGILANRMQSRSAVDILKKTADMDNAKAAVGPAAATTLSKQALEGLAMANTVQSKAFIAQVLKAAATVHTQGDPVTGPLKGNWAALTGEDSKRLEKKAADVQRVGIERYLKQGYLARDPD